MVRNHEPVFTAGDLTALSVKMHRWMNSSQLSGISGWRLHGKRPGVAAEDAAQNVVAAGVQELMAEEELPEIAMPEGLDDIDNQWEDEDFEELDAEVPQENAASLAEHTAEQTKPEALAEADDTMEAGTSAEDVGSSYFSRDCAPDGKRISGKRRITGD